MSAKDADEKTLNKLKRDEFSAKNGEKRPRVWTDMFGIATDDESYALSHNAGHPNFPLIEVVPLAALHKANEEIERLKLSRDLVYKESDRRLQEWGKTQGELAQARQLVEVLEAAVKFYADRENWHSILDGAEQYWDNLIDSVDCVKDGGFNPGGKRAREALAEIKRMKDGV